MSQDFGWLFDDVDEVWRRTAWFCMDCGSAQGSQVYVPGKAMGGSWVAGTTFYECTDCVVGGVRYIMTEKMLEKRHEAIRAEAEQEAANVPFEVYGDGTEVFVNLGGHEILARVAGYQRLVNAWWSLTGVVTVRVSHTDEPLMLREGAKLIVAACVLTPAVKVH